MHFQTEIPKRSSACNAGGEPFVAGMDYFSVLSKDAENGLLRQDFCPKCWELQEESKSKGKISWQSNVVPAKDCFNSQAKEREHRICQLFQTSSDKEADPAERFILALYLQRRKKLILRSEYINEAGETILLYEIPETEEMLSIKKATPSGMQVQSIQQSIAKKLKGHAA